MRISSLTASAAAALLILSGCSSEPAGNESPSPQRSHESQSTQSEHPPEQSKEQSKGQSDSQSNEKSDDANKSDSKASSHRRNTVTVSAGSKTIEIEPTDVYCSGRPGHIHHIIGKTNNRLPLVKAEETHFAMAKIGHGRPYKAGDPNGVRYGKNSVTFNDTTLGSAVMNGTMTCTAWED